MTEQISYTAAEKCDPEGKEYQRQERLRYLQAEEFDLHYRA
jgi:hypothetical protein